MKNLISKSDFFKYLQCPKYFWLWKHKPEVLGDQSLDEFTQQIIDQGHEVESWARKLFPDGVMVESKQQQAIIDTQMLLDEGCKTIFQATFEAKGFYAMVDILSWDEPSQRWIINEVKGTTSKDVKKEEHYADACFQRFVMQKAGYNISQVNLLELNKEFRKDGDIIAKLLIQTTDITNELDEIASNIEIQMDDALRLLQNPEEPRVCNCIHQSRANHCPAFKYCHPEVPDYSVHDICRIGASKKKLREIIDNGWLKIEDIPLDYELSKTQQPQVYTTITGETIIETDKVRQSLDKIEYPIYFLDYETYPAAVPVFDGCYPFQQVPFQYSLHILREPGGEIEHREFLQELNENPMPALAHQLREDIGDTGSVIVWNQKFEMKCNEDLAEAVPELAEFLHGLNQRVYDLMEVFAKQHYVHKDFRGSSSIKYVLPVLCPELTYQDLNIHNGGMACNGWKKMIFEIEDHAEKSQLATDLKAYCELDTFAMVRIWEELCKI